MRKISRIGVYNIDSCAQKRRPPSIANEGLATQKLHNIAKVDSETNGRKFSHIKDRKSTFEGHLK
jgi:hypothetical protein